MKTERETMAISEFKAKCLQVLSRIQRTGATVLVTRRGTPMALITAPTPEAHAGSWLGCLRESGRITGDVVSPVADPAEWEAIG